MRLRWKLENHLDVVYATKCFQFMAHMHSSFRRMCEILILLFIRVHCSVFGMDDGQTMAVQWEIGFLFGISNGI